MEDRLERQGTQVNFFIFILSETASPCTLLGLNHFDYPQQEQNKSWVLKNR
ncbi:MAG: hypothetical protein ACJ75B_00575 [Flavisolibacter sp.]